MDAAGRDGGLHRVDIPVSRQLAFEFGLFVGRWTSKGRDSSKSLELLRRTWRTLLGDGLLLSVHPYPNWVWMLGPRTDMHEDAFTYINGYFSTKLI